LRAGELAIDPLVAAEPSSEALYLRLRALPAD
jgi:hypothetical protein